VAGGDGKPSRRQRGEIETRPSGSLLVRVYAGIDALSGRRHYLVETVPAGPKPAAEPERVRRRLVNQVDEQRNPRTKATVNQLMDRYLELVDVEDTTLERYEQAIRIHQSATGSENDRFRDVSPRGPWRLEGRCFAARVIQDRR
jgi:hypothetical protein